MQRGFPLSLLTRVCCSKDRGALRPAVASDDLWLVDATVRCDSCAQSYVVRDGVLSLLDAADLHPESATEMHTRDARSAALLDGQRHEWRSRFADAVEVQPTLDAVSVGPGMIVGEIGCGPGRYTLALAAQASAVVAVDFSRAGLLVLKSKLAADAPVALVHADVTRPYGAPASFARLLSTLHSNLPDRAHRAQALRWMADASTDDGVAVVSMHHYSTRERLAGTARAGRYPDSDIYRYFMTVQESAQELAPWFAHARHRYIAATVPGLPSAWLARAVARTPVVRATLSTLFLALAERPRRSAEGHP